MQKTYSKASLGNINAGAVQDHFESGMDRILENVKDLVVIA